MEWGLSLVTTAGMAEQLEPAELTDSGLPRYEKGETKWKDGERKGVKIYSIDEKQKSPPGAAVLTTHRILWLPESGGARALRLQQIAAPCAEEVRLGRPRPPPLEPMA